MRRRLSGLLKRRDGRLATSLKPGSFSPRSLTPPSGWSDGVERKRLIVVDVPSVSHAVSVDTEIAARRLDRALA